MNAHRDNEAIDLRDWQGMKRAVDLLVRMYGQENVKQVALDVAKDVEEREAELDLVKPEKFFGENEWMGWAGASRFPDGVRPVYTEMSVEIDVPEATVKEGDPHDEDEERIEVGSVEEVAVVIGADEDGRSPKAFTEFTISNGYTYSFMFPSLKAAILFTRRLRSGGSTPLSELIAYGWST
jgi:hypothetical protein